jgi:purine-binding chemotaxis protein CheW
MTNHLAETSSPDLHGIIFQVAGQEYITNVAVVQEIIQPTDLLSLQGAPECVEGVIKRRGRVLPILDLCRCLGLPDAASSAKHWVIVARLSVGPVGFKVEFVSELIWIETREFEPPSPALALASQPYLRGIAHLGDRVLVWLDLERVLSALGQAGERLAALPAGPSATTEPPAQAMHTLLTFELGDELYGVATTEIAEVRELLPLMPLPRVPSHILGLVNLRGAVLPVLDLRHKFNLDGGREDAPKEKRLVILKGGGYLVALRVDRIRGLARLPLTAFQPPPTSPRLEAEYYARITALNGRLLTELDVPKLLAHTALNHEH